MRTTASRPVADPAWDPPEWNRVVRWRCDQLLLAGFPEQLAQVLSVARDVDLHALLALVDRGCPPALAVHILGVDDLPSVRGS